MIALILTACAPTTVPAGATENRLCRIWSESLPTRSHMDTAQTATEIGAAYADFAAACPDLRGMIP
jgi:hypothetical protein